MVNPYLSRQRLGSPAQQAKSTAQVSLGHSQALKKVESIQRKQQKAELKKIKKETKSSNLSKKDKKSAISILDSTSSEDDEEPTTSDDTSDSVLKNVKSKSNKFLKKPTQSKKLVADASQEDDDEEDDIKDEEIEQDESIKEEGNYYSEASSHNLVVIPSTSRVSSVSSIKQKGNRVTFEKKISKKDKSESEAIELSTTNDQTDDSSTEGGAVNKNIIFDINDLDLLDNGKKTNKKEMVSIIKNKKPNESDKKDLSIIDNNSSDESLSLSMRKNVILDIDDLDNDVTVITKKPPTNDYQNVNKPPKSDLAKKPELKSSLSKKQKRKRNSSRSQSLVSIISQDSDSIVTEIINENIETESIASDTYQTANDSTSHRVASASKPKTESFASNYQEDFDTESDISKIQSIMSKSNGKSSTVGGTKSKEKLRASSTAKSVETQCNDIDLLKNSNLFVESPLFTPFSVAGKRVDWNQYLDLNVANNAFNDLMKMNLDFMKNFINIQRQMYENEMRSLQQQMNK